MKKSSGIIKTTRGVMLDMNRLSRANESEIAITGGGLSMNARGDLLGAGGKVVRTREEFERAYNIENERAAKHVVAKQISIKKPNLTPDNLSLDRVKKEKPDNIATEEFSLEQISEAMNISDKKKRKTVEE
ncbi:MAG: hypothetical protein HC836_30350 [Richelia sp. RM2_1_2]|nr:hypothetical protein [Richelia sp. RM2_1_2]